MSLSTNLIINYCFKLTSDSLQLVSLKHTLFFNTLHCVVCAQQFVLDQVHLAEGPTTHHFNDLEIVFRHN